MLDRIRQFQKALVELGVARNILALPAPKTLLLEDHTSESEDGTTIFGTVVTEPEISTVSRDLYASGHYNLSVSEAFKAIDKYIEGRTKSGLSGTSLMRDAFKPKGPKLAWSDRLSQSEKDEQEGYDHMYAGAMLGIRNPTTHEFDWIDNQEVALELLIFAQHLLRKAKSAATSQ